MVTSPDESPRARFESARARHDAVAAELTQKQAELHKLSAELVTRGGNPVVVPDLPKTTVSTADANALPPDALLRIAEDLDRATAELETVRAAFDASAAELTARLGGESVHAKLAPAPRRVPTAYSLAEWASTACIVALGVTLGLSSLLGIVGAVLAHNTPLRFVPLAALVIVLGATAGAALPRVRLLARGALPVSTTATSKKGIGGYTNAHLEELRGWDSVRIDYTGPVYVSTVRFVASDGSAGELVVNGLEYTNGAILCEPGGGPDRKARGMLITEFRSHPRPDATGQWRGTLEGPRGAIVAALLLVAVWVIGAVVVAVTGHGSASKSHHPHHASMLVQPSGPFASESRASGVEERSSAPNVGV